MREFLFFFYFFHVSRNFRLYATEFAFFSGRFLIHEVLWVELMVDVEKCVSFTFFFDFFHVSESHEVAVVEKSLKVWIFGRHCENETIFLGLFFDEWREMSPRHFEREEHFCTSGFWSSFEITRCDIVPRIKRPRASWPCMNFHRFQCQPVFSESPRDYSGKSDRNGDFLTYFAKSSARPFAKISREMCFFFLGERSSERIRYHRSVFGRKLSTQGSRDRWKSDDYLFRSDQWDVCFSWDCRNRDSRGVDKSNSKILEQVAIVTRNVSGKIYRLRVENARHFFPMKNADGA